MPQVAARINEEQERWLKDYFRTKSAGAEFILPWAVDTFFRAITSIKQIFSASELKTIVETVSGSNHEHANKTVLDGITSENVAAWNASEANAKAYADALVAAMTAWGDF